MGGSEKDEHPLRGRTGHETGVRSEEDLQTP